VILFRKIFACSKLGYELLIRKATCIF